MNQFNYFQNLRDVLQGLPEAEINQLVAEFETKLREGLASGRSEESIIAEWPAPSVVAAQRKKTYIIAL